jgi:hypothetical protein
MLTWRMSRFARVRGITLRGLKGVMGLYGFGRSWRIIQDVPNLSLSIANLRAKKVSCIGMKI